MRHLYYIANIPFAGLFCIIVTTFISSCSIRWVFVDESIAARLFSVC